MRLPCIFRRSTKHVIVCTCALRLTIPNARRPCGVVVLGVAAGKRFEEQCVDGAAVPAEPERFRVLAVTLRETAHAHEPTPARARPICGRTTLREAVARGGSPVPTVVSSRKPSSRRGWEASHWLDPMAQWGQGRPAKARPPPVADACSSSRGSPVGGSRRTLPPHTDLATLWRARSS